MAVSDFYEFKKIVVVSLANETLLLLKYGFVENKNPMFIMGNDTYLQEFYEKIVSRQLVNTLLHL